MSVRYSALLLAAVTVAVFLAQVYVSGFTEALALVSSEATERPWILVTSIFAHGSLAHLLGNMFALGVFGLVLENIIGTRKFLAVYFLSGMVSGIASLFFYESALGASGAIFGVLGMLAVLRPRMIVWTYGVPMPMVAATAFWLLLDILGVFYPSSIANIAHIAGLIFGAVAGMAMRRKFAESGKRAGSEEKTVRDEEFDEWEEEWM